MADYPFLYDDLLQEQRQCASCGTSGNVVDMEWCSGGAHIGAAWCHRYCLQVDETGLKSYCIHCPAANAAALRNRLASPMPQPESDDPFTPFSTALPDDGVLQGSRLPDFPLQTDQPAYQAHHVSQDYHGQQGLSFLNHGQQGLSFLNHGQQGLSFLNHGQQDLSFPNYGPATVNPALTHFDGHHSPVPAPANPALGHVDGGYALAEIAVDLSTTLVDQHLPSASASDHYNEDIFSQDSHGPSNSIIMISDSEDDEGEDESVRADEIDNADDLDDVYERGDAAENDSDEFPPAYAGTLPFPISPRQPPSRSPARKSPAPLQLSQTNDPSSSLQLPPHPRYRRRTECGPHSPYLPDDPSLLSPSLRSTKRGGWCLREQEACNRLMRSACLDPKVQGEKRYDWVTEMLEKETFTWAEKDGRIHYRYFDRRPANSVKNHWSRKLRRRFNFDERSPRKDGRLRNMITSERPKQDASEKKKKKRRGEQTVPGQGVFSVAAPMVHTDEVNGVMGSGAETSSDAKRKRTSDGDEQDDVDADADADSDADADADDDDDWLEFQLLSQKWRQGSPNGQGDVAPSSLL